MQESIISTGSNIQTKFIYIIAINMTNASKYDEFLLEFVKTYLITITISLIIT